MYAELKTKEFSTIDLRQNLYFFTRWAWLIAISALLAGGAAYLVSNAQPPVYEATATLLINEAPGSGTSQYNAVLTSERLARTYSEMLTKPSLIEEVSNRMDLPDLIDEEFIKIQLVNNTQLIDIIVEDTNPELAAAIANNLMVVFNEQNQVLQASRFTEFKSNLEEQLKIIEEQINTTETSLGQLTEGTETASNRQRLETQLSQFLQVHAHLTQSYESIRVTEAQSTSNVIILELAKAPDETHPAACPSEHCAGSRGRWYAGYRRHFPGAGFG